MRYFRPFATLSDGGAARTTSAHSCDQRCRGVGTTPPAGNAGQAEAADLDGDVGSAGQLMTVWLEAEQYPDQQQRCAGSPGLG